VVWVVQLGEEGQSRCACEPQAIARAGKLVVVSGGHEPDAIADARAARLVAVETDVAVGVRPLLEADQQREVAVAEIGREEDLVALEARVRAAELSRPAGGRRPEPPLLAGVTRRDDEGTRAAESAPRTILEKPPVAPLA